jgi:hypothetical protein
MGRYRYARLYGGRRASGASSRVGNGLRSCSRASARRSWCGSSDPSQGSTRSPETPSPPTDPPRIEVADARLPLHHPGARSGLRRTHHTHQAGTSTFTASSVGGMATSGRCHAASASIGAYGASLPKALALPEARSPFRSPSGDRPRSQDLADFVQRILTDGTCAREVARIGEEDLDLASI